MKKSMASIKIISVIIFVLMVVFGSVWLLVHNSSQEEVRTYIAERKTVIQDVLFTGHVEPKRSVNLSFELAGQVEQRSVDVGDHVTEGQILLTLNPATVELELAQAQAAAASAKEEARNTWQKADNERANTVKENEQARQKKRQAVIDAKSELDQAELVWQRTKSESGDDSAAAETSKNLVVKAQSSYNAAQQELSATLSMIAKVNQSVNDAAELTREKYLSTTQAAARVSGPSVVDATRALAEMRVAKSVIIAPFDGVVTRVVLEPKEYATAGSSVVTVVSVDEIKIVSSVPETDALKVMAGLSAKVTFDAIEKTQDFSAKVISVAPAAVVIEGVPTYEVTLELSSSESILKPGLTANVTVHIASRDNVIAVPRRSLIFRGNEQYVRVLKSPNNIIEVPVTAGLVGSDGSVEIISGLSVGDSIVVSTPKNDGTN